MKGQAETTEVLSIVAIAALTIALMPIIITIFKDTSKLISTTPEVVSKDISSLVSISTAAPDQIKIEYTIDSADTYDVEMSERMVFVKKTGDQDFVSNPIVVDIDASLDDINKIEIEKQGINVLVDGS